MKIKVDLAAFEALTQEQIATLAFYQEDGDECWPPTVRNVRFQESTYSDTAIVWGSVWDGDDESHTGSLSVTEYFLTTECDGEAGEVRWETIGLLAEYNVITFQP